MADDVNDKPETREEAIDLARAYMDGRRSHWNAICSDADVSNRQFSPTSFTAMADAATAQGWIAVAATLPSRGDTEALRELVKRIDARGFPWDGKSGMFAITREQADALERIVGDA